MSLFLDRFLKITSVLTPIFLIYYIFNQDYSSAREIYKEWFALISLTLFNTTHIFITPLKAIYIPEFKSLTLLRHFNFYIRGLALFIAGFLLYYVSVASGPVNSAANTIFKLLVFGANIHHCLMQTYGLSARLGYTSHRSRYIEKYSVLFLFFIATVAFGLARTNFELYVQPVTFFILFAWLFLSFLIYKSTEPSIKSEKLFYLLRYLAFALYFINPILTLITMNFHGIEYLKTYIDMGARSKISRPVYFRSILIIFLFVPLTAIFLHLDASHILFNISIPATTYDFIKSTIIGLSFLHYYADSQFYRMQDLEVRKNIAPLLSLTKV